MKDMPAHQPGDAFTSVKQTLTDAAEIVATFIMNRYIWIVSIVKTGQAIQFNIVLAIIPVSESG